MPRRLLLFFTFLLVSYAPCLSAVTFLVTTNADNGPGSLRQAILDANATPGPDAIHFSIGSGPKTIQLATALPTVTDTVDIDGTTQPGFSNRPVIEIVGFFTIPRGLDIVSGSNVVRSLAIHSFASTKLHLGRGGGNLIIGNYLGLNLAGGFVANSGASGIALQESSGNQIGLPGFGNVLSGNGASGILMALGSHSNVVEENFIGTDPSGTVARGNQRDGVFVSTGCSWNTISSNVISGNNGNGIYLSAAPFNVIEGNYIGCDVAGGSSIRNGLCGINLLDTSDTTIGGINIAARNIISGNSVHGIEIVGLASVNNVVQGNYIGLDLSGLAPLPNSASGVFLNSTAGNLIGGAESGARNLISGNPGSGVSISGGSDNIIQGNFIGLNRTGSASLGNGFGISVNDSRQNLIGGGEAETRNIISGNSIDGIAVSGFGAASANLILGNYIGTDPSGVVALPNYRGVVLSGSSPNNLVQSNLVSGNLLQGMSVGGYSNVVVGNFVGTDATGRKALPNRAAGIGVGLIGNTIGGTEPESRNVVSGNGGHGIEVYPGQAAGSYGHVIQGNFVGVDVSGAVALPNGAFGVAVGTQRTTVGGSEPGAGNVISGNRAGGVSIGSLGGLGASTTNVVHGNLIGTDPSGIFGVPNRGPGILLTAPARNNFIGGIDPAEANVIAFNAGDGVLVISNSAGNAILGNSIHSNGRLGINLKPAAEGEGVVTVNDIGDSDTGPNNLQNYPVITNVVYLANNTIIQGFLRSATNESFSIDVYANVATEQSGYGEGQFYLGNVDVDTDESGFTEFAYSAGNTYSNQFFTATALNYDTADTSEFSAAMGGIRITAIERIASQYRVSFSTITNRTYVLQRASSLNSSMSWSPVVLPPQPIQGTGGIVTVSDMTPSTDTMRIYRVFQQP